MADDVEQDVEMLKSLLVEGEWISSTFGDGNPRELTIQLPRSSTLRVSFAETTSLPVYTVSSERRALQEALAERIKQYDSQAQLQDEQYPVTFVYTALKEYIDDLPEDNTSIVEGVASDKTPTPRKPIRTKCILFWAHHLLATSKRKDIHKFSLELHLWSLAKIGYPGVIVAQGLADDVDEFLRRIKAMQWYALQVRHEEVMEHEGNDEDHILTTQCALRAAVAHGRNLPLSSKPCSREMDSMSELSAL
ncbi:hypothetical protein EMMF5_005230 [Cystobasidiomycetes sp. EMM_F5]